MQITNTCVNFNIALVLLNVMQYFNAAMTRPLESEANKSEITIEDNKNMTTIYNEIYNITSEIIHRDFSKTTGKLRTKRQAGGVGKFGEATKMGQLKLLVLFLQMWANMWRDVYVGGAHPLHPDVPKPVVVMLKRRIGEFIFPKEKDEDNK
ncbi:uncharacterized protein LOC128678043 [Plodia interpunctella]|uniref:uncharacterized protein LOC128678043 n=1 Tax=Plodia interpunctella TaxID=58824 RepID=UPI002367E15B|nr:uncharacterized protein LOC128678043 [Plodia interpunctella]